MPPPEDTLEDKIYTRAVVGNRKLYNRGPQGLGDPYDKSLDDFEWKVGIPAQQREIIKRERCTKENLEYETCRKETWIFNRLISCSNAKKELSKCVECWMNDTDIRERAIVEYIEDRSAYRETGLTKWERQHPDYVAEQRAKRLIKSKREGDPEDKSVTELYKDAWRRFRNKESEPKNKENV